MKQERWQKFTKSQQIGSIGAEIIRAETWREKDKDHFLSAIERVLELIDSTLNDNKWQNNRSMIFWLRDELAKFYIGENQKYSLNNIYDAL